MAHWTIVCLERQDTSDPGPRKSLSVLLDTETERWSAHGVNVAMFLSVANGSFTFIPGREAAVTLSGAGNKWLGSFLGLTASSAVGAKGSGRTELRHVDWTLQSK